MTIAIEVKGLVKIYDGKVRALDGVDLKVKAGDVFALLGPNGSGKTTLMRILTTQFKPTSGEASIFGLDVVRRDSEIRKIISYVPQETSYGLISAAMRIFLYTPKFMGFNQEIGIRLSERHWKVWVWILLLTTLSRHTLAA